MAQTQTKQKKEIILTPEGVLVNHALFERDAFQNDRGGAPGKALYKVEMAFTPDEIAAFEDKMADFVDAEFGKGEGDKFLNGQGGYISPLLSGDEMAKAREAKGKPGDAYKGKLVLRAKTTFNKDGVEGPGGMRVLDEECNTIGLVEGNTASVYRGCIGQAAVTLSTYVDYPRRGDKGVTVYLSAFQKRGDGTPIKSDGPGAAGMFTKVAPPVADGVRRKRAG